MVILSKHKINVPVVLTVHDLYRIVCDYFPFDSFKKKGRINHFADYFIATL
jgi:hypothetical protein